MKALSNLVDSPKEELKNDVYPSKQLSIQDVIKGIQCGDESAIGYIYNQYINDLFRFGNQISKDKEVVKDCIQDVFLTVIRGNVEIKKIKSIKSYLFKSLYRTIIDKLKKDRKYSLNHPVIENLEGFEIEISSESRMINDESYLLKVAKVNNEIRNLSKKQKQALLHFYYDGFSQEEIAEIMNLKNQNSVTRLIRRGLDAIRQSIPISVMLLINTLY